MLYVLVFPIVVIAVVLIYLALQSGDIAVRRSTVIRCAPEVAFDLVRDLRSWPDWSPWLLHEPDAVLTFSDAAAAERGWYAWDGKLIGAGRITQVALHPVERIEQRIEFKRPFKLTAAVSWEFAAIEEDGAPATRVYWLMRGRMPFFMRFIAPTMSGLIGKDFELGLVRLRARLEPGAPRLDLRFPGVVELPAQNAWTIPFDGGKADIKAAMQDGFGRLLRAAAERGIEPVGAPFAAYHMGDPKSGRLRCDMALAVPAGADPGEFAGKFFVGGPCQVTEVRGSYDFMELAWHAAMGHLRLSKRQWDRFRPALEVYERGPDQAAGDDELVTRICMPTKG
jgi:DNA gyrase inhibitor GyrI/ribosome-associated toxin RatA of RatAB toxin-antitoxin module